MLMIAVTADHSKTLLALFVMLAAAKILAEVFERLRQPAVVGEILAGVLIGPGLLNWVQPGEITALLAEVGVIFLLFTVGLETMPAAILRVGKSALLVAVLGVVVPLLGGWALMRAFGESNLQSLFVGTAMVATSVGITARVLGGLGLLDAPTARIILGAAVIDDILGLLVLAVVSNLARGAVDVLQLAKTTALAVGFTVFVALVAAPLITRFAPRIERLRTGDSFFLFGLLLCLGLSVAASFIGVAAIIGAFLAGMALAEATEGNKRVHDLTNGVTEFLVPFFLVDIGLQLRLDVFRDSRVIGMAFAVTLVAVATKLLACAAASWGLGKRRALQVGMGMVPRGEVGIVVAQLGLALGVIGDSLFAVVLFMAVATTLIAPPFLKLLYAGEAANGAEIESNDAGGILPDAPLSRLG